MVRFGSAVLIGLTSAALVAAECAAASNPRLPEKIAAAIRKELDAQLRDYPSARFRDVRMAADGPPGELVCGFVNSKTGSGGYTGWEPFMAGAKPDASGAIVTMGGRTTGSILAEVCREQKWLPGDISDQLKPR